MYQIELTEHITLKRDTITLKDPLEAIEAARTLAYAINETHTVHLFKALDGELFEQLEF